MSKGIIRKPGIYRKGRRNGSFSGSQGTITADRKYPHIKKGDISKYALPIIKEIGKAVCPPAALTIEVLYQIYKHADAIRDVGSAVMNEDYRKAAEIVAKEITKDVGEALVVNTIDPSGKTSDSLAGNISNNMPANEQGKEATKKVIEGTLKGGVEATADKVVDEAEKVVKKVVDNENERSETKNN